MNMLEEDDAMEEEAAKELYKKMRNEGGLNDNVEKNMEVSDELIKNLRKLSGCQSERLQQLLVRIRIR